MKIKILAFNTLEGFVYKDKEGKYRVSDRQKIAQKIISKETPDILILTEANFCLKTFGKPTQNYNKIFSYKYGIFGSDFDWGVGILSKYPMIESHDYTTKHSRFVRAIINVKGKKIMVDGVHPDPYHSEHQRAQWFKTVIRDRKSNYIIAGDLNAFSPQDKYDKRKLIKGFELSLKQEDKHKAKNIVNDILTGEAINVLLKDKLIDTYKIKNKKWDYSYHTSLNGSNPDYCRIDYIFCSDDFKILQARIIKNKLTEKASDHYPIYTILEI